MRTSVSPLTEEKAADAVPFPSSGIFLPPVGATSPSTVESETGSDPLSASALQTLTPVISYGDCAGVHMVTGGVESAPTRPPNGGA